MAGAFEPVDGEEIYAELDGGFCVPDGGAFVDYNAFRGFQLSYYSVWIVPGGLDDADSFFDNDSSVRRIVGCVYSGEDGYVHAEGFECH